MSRPRAQLDLIFLLAGCDARRARLLPRTRALLDHADFDALARDLAQRRLLPLIGTRAVEAAPDLVPESFQHAVSAARAAARARGLGVEAVTGQAVRLLSEAGIRALPLKGPLLAQEAHGDVGLRETSDIDLLVPAERLDAAAETLASLGYSAPEGVRRANGLPDLHFELLHPDKPRIDLHWRIHWYEETFAAQMIAAAEPGPDGLLRPLPRDLLAALLLFQARDGFHGIRVAADLAAWWDRHGEGLPRAFLEPVARAHPTLAPALTAAAIATERLTGAPATEWLGGAATRSRRVSLATRLADWSGWGDRDQLQANIMLVGGLLGPPRSVPEFALRELTLAGESSAATASHAAKVLGRWAIALWKVRGGRAWTDAAA